MDLTLSAAERDLAAAARAAFAAGAPPPVTAGPLTDLVLVARELGRAAVRSRFHTDVLAGLLGWNGDGRVAVALHVTGGRHPVADYVAWAGDAEIFLVRTGPDRVAVVGAEAVAMRPQPMLGDDDRWQVTLPAGLAGLAGDTPGDIRPGDARPGDTRDVDSAVARAAVLVSADAVGAAHAAMDAAVRHVHQRRQWGRPLASLQAVRHRCADMLLDVTLATDAVFDAAGVADRGAPAGEFRLAAAYAKAGALERCRRVTASAHQLAGGQGIHADAPFHRWYRRVKAAEPEFGDTRAHREAVAAALLDGPPGEQPGERRDEQPGERPGGRYSGR